VSRRCAAAGRQRIITGENAYSEVEKMTYKAKVVKVYTRPHPDADRLKLATALGYQVVVGLNTQDGDLMVFFRSDGQLSEQFAQSNDLVRRTNPETGAKEGGFFEANRRVRAQKFRGAKSEGFLAPLSYFEFTGHDLDRLKIGDEFDSLNGVPICNKYVTRATRHARQRSIKHRRETTMFRMHIKTDQFRDAADIIPPESLITITEKLHGTSHRLGHVLDKMPLPWWKRALNRFGARFSHKMAWRYLSGTRRVILEHHDGATYYSNDGFRYRAVERLQNNLHKGEVVYMEIVGWAGQNEPIMQPQNISKLRDGDVKKSYGDEMIYSYGCEPGECKAFVYRIVQANEDGVQFELPWRDVKRRCDELGIDHVPEYSQRFHTLDGRGLRAVIESYIDGPSVLDSSHIREGVAIRVDNEHGTHFYKHKSFTFGLLEGYLKDSEDFVDREEAA
jgi:hypothetical protein